MTTDRLAIFILASLVVVMTAAFAWYAIGTDDELDRMRKELAGLKREPVKPYRPTVAELYPERTSQ